MGSVAPESARSPVVSVVVATRDRAARVPLLLGALAAQTLPREAFEIVVVDDGSRDDTAAVLAAAPGVDRTVRLPASRGPAAARNAGWRAARAPLVAFTDDDCRPEPTWLAAGLAVHRAAPLAIVQGRTRPEPDGEALLGHPRARSIRIDGLGPFFETCNVFYPRASLVATGGFDERIRTPGSEDTDLALRVLARANGAPGAPGARFAPDAVVNHEVRVLTLPEAVRFTRRWGTLPWLVRRHPGLRRAFAWRGFVWREAHARLLLALAGLALARRHRLFLLWCVPYLSLRHGWRPTGLARSLREVPGTAAVDAAEVAVLAAASVRERSVLL